MASASVSSGPREAAAAHAASVALARVMRSLMADFLRDKSAYLAEWRAAAASASALAAPRFHPWIPFASWTAAPLASRSVIASFVLRRDLPSRIKRLGLLIGKQASIMQKHGFSSVAAFEQAWTAQSEHATRDLEEARAEWNAQLQALDTELEANSRPLQRGQRLSKEVLDLPLHDAAKPLAEAHTTLRQVMQGQIAVDSKSAGSAASSSSSSSSSSPSPSSSSVRPVSPLFLLVLLRHFG